jgi:hypothetical protein
LDEFVEVRKDLGNHQQSGKRQKANQKYADVEKCQVPVDAGHWGSLGKSGPL